MKYVTDTVVVERQPSRTQQLGLTTVGLGAAGVLAAIENTADIRVISAHQYSHHVNLHVLMS